MSDFHFARRCGWRYEWVAELRPEIYHVLLDELLKEDEATRGD